MCFEMIDRSLSSVFEDIESLDLPSEDVLISKSWESLSRILSGGSLFFKGEPVRAVGLNRIEGELEACGPDGELLIRDLEFLNWEYLSN